MEGHPWWPCMIVPQPLTGQQMRGRGRDQRLHVHFFDEPPTRGWVNTKYIREYQGEQVQFPEEHRLCQLSSQVKVLQYFILT